MRGWNAPGGLPPSASALRAFPALSAFPAESAAEARRANLLLVAFLASLTRPRRVTLIWVAVSALFRMRSPGIERRLIADPSIWRTAYADPPRATTRASTAITSAGEGRRNLGRRMRAAFPALGTPGGPVSRRDRLPEDNPRP